MPTLKDALKKLGIDVDSDVNDPTGADDKDAEIADLKKQLADIEKQKEVDKLKAQVEAAKAESQVQDDDNEGDKSGDKSNEEGEEEEAKPEPTGKTSAKRTKAATTDDGDKGANMESRGGGTGKSFL